MHHTKAAVNISVPPVSHVILVSYIKQSVIVLQRIKKTKIN